MYFTNSWCLEITQPNLYNPYPTGRRATNNLMHFLYSYNYKRIFMQTLSGSNTYDLHFT